MVLNGNPYRSSCSNSWSVSELKLLPSCRPRDSLRRVPVEELPWMVRQWGPEWIACKNVGLHEKSLGKCERQSPSTTRRSKFQRDARWRQLHAQAMLRTPPRNSRTGARSFGGADAGAGAGGGDGGGG